MNYKEQIIFVPEGTEREVAEDVANAVLSKKLGFDYTLLYASRLDWEDRYNVEAWEALYEDLTE